MTTIKNATPEFNAALNSFVAAITERNNASHARQFPNLPPKSYTVEPGSKNVRIVCNGSGRYVYCFVRITDGAILKAAGWKAPAKHARGSIYENPLDAVTDYGAKYLR